MRWIFFARIRWRGTFSNFSEYLQINYINSGLLGNRFHLSYSHTFWPHQMFSFRSRISFCFSLIIGQKSLIELTSLYIIFSISKNRVISLEDTLFLIWMSSTTSILSEHSAFVFIWSVHSIQFHCAAHCCCEYLLALLLLCAERTTQYSYICCTRTFMLNRTFTW